MQARGRNGKEAQGTKRTALGQLTNLRVQPSRAAKVWSSSIFLSPHLT